jgi:hypothetical protein
VSNLALRVCFNDGVAVYLNGTEIFRRNLGAGAAYEDYATASNTNQAQDWFSVPIAASLLRTGTNEMAAEVHRFDADGPSLIFDLQLAEAKVDSPPGFTSMRFTNGAFNASLRGPNGLRVRIDSSADFADWQLNRFVTLTNGVATFSELATNTARFYRIPQ